MRFPCPDVTKADFSANEEYITLYSVVHRRGMKIPDMLISVFDVQSGRKLRSLQVCCLFCTWLNIEGYCAFDSSL
jgi:hypothetical protein